jgi:hypothetical protein
MILISRVSSASAPWRFFCWVEFGYYVPQDPAPQDQLYRRGEIVFDHGLFWFKGQHIGCATARRACQYLSEHVRTRGPGSRLRPEPPRVSALRVTIPAVIRSARSRPRLSDFRLWGRSDHVWPTRPSRSLTRSGHVQVEARTRLQGEQVSQPVRRVLSLSPERCTARIVDWLVLSRMTYQPFRRRYSRSLPAAQFRLTE